MIALQDLIVDTFTNATPVKVMRILHRPTGLVVIGEAVSSYSLRKRLMTELEQKLLDTVVPVSYNLAREAELPPEIP